MLNFGFDSRGYKEEIKRSILKLKQEMLEAEQQHKAELEENARKLAEMKEEMRQSKVKNAVQIAAQK